MKTLSLKLLFNHMVEIMKLLTKFFFSDLCNTELNDAPRFLISATIIPGYFLYTNSIKLFNTCILLKVKI